ncbi:hypothetical protein DFH06DRAFT_1348567 [Mycena polygramma]|nr:hypothetical protein DFH06DRAFT_1348567 [Mycena polygramma]
MDFVDVTQMGYVDVNQSMLGDPVPPAPRPPAPAYAPARHSPPCSPSSAASDSDGDATEDNYSETAAKEKKKTLKERELFHRKKDDRLQEEVDQSDEEAFEQEVQAEEERKAKATASKSTTKKSSTKKTSTSKSTSTSTSTSKTKSTATSKARSASKVSSKVKGKQRARSPPQSGDEPEHEGSADEEDGQDDDGDEGEKGSGGNKCGPVDAEARKQLFEWKDEYEGKVEGLAVRLHKPSSVLWRIVGSEPRHVRQTSAWNMFQAWLYSPNGGKHTADKNLTAQERSAYDKAAYVKALKDAGLDADTHPTTSAVVKKMPWLADWYKELEAAILADQSDKGARKRGITAVAREATSLGERAYKDLNLHVCGYIIDTDGGSKAFGSSPAFQLMKQRYDTQMRKTLKEYESRIHVLQMELEGASAAAVLKDRERQVDLPSNTAYKNSADARDAKRKFIKDRLIQDILAIMVARGDISLEDASAHTLDMKWTSWDDFAFSNQLRLENWDDEMAGRQAYPHRGFSLTKFSAEDIKRIVPKMEARLRLNQTVDEQEADSVMEDVDVDADEALRIVAWEDDECTQPLEEQANIGLLTTVSGKTLLTVSDSKKWSSAVAKEKARAERQRLRADAARAKRQKPPTPGSESDDAAAKSRPKRKRAASKGAGLPQRIRGAWPWIYAQRRRRTPASLVLAAEPTSQEAGQARRASPI